MVASFIHPRKSIIRGGELFNQLLKVDKLVVDAIKLEKILLVSPAIYKTAIFKNLSIEKTK